MPLPELRRIPGWVPVFLKQVQQGRTDRTAAQIAEVPLPVVRKHMEKDPKFKAEYEEALSKQMEQPDGGLI